MKNLGDIIAIKRQNKQMTQDEFATKIGVTPQAVSKWERGQGFPDVTLLSGICNVLSIDANELLGIDFPRDGMENNDKSMQQEIQNSMIAEPIKLEFASNLIPAFIDGLQTNFVHEHRKNLVMEKGILLPVLRLKDNHELRDYEYKIISYDKVLKEGMADGTNKQIFQKVILDVIRVCDTNYAEIINKQVVKTMIDNLSVMYPGVVEGVIPDKIPEIVVLNVLKEVLKEKGNIRNLIKLVEVLEEEYVINHNQNVKNIVEKIMKHL